MNFSKEATGLAGAWLVHPRPRPDPRGWFQELFEAEDFAALDLPSGFMQLNASRSRAGVVRGLHFQFRPPMAKLVWVSRGRAFLVAVDIRPSSPTLGRWYGIEAGAGTAGGGPEPMLFAGAGFARGFLTLEDDTEVQYACTACWNPAGEGAIRWDDPALGIGWPTAGRAPLMSEKDAAAPLLAHWLARPEAALLDA